jgi:hypothetical protein
MKKFVLLFVFFGIVSVTSVSHAVPMLQYADSVIKFSSQWSDRGWSARKALGRPNTDEYGDIRTAWAPESKNGTEEFLTLGFGTPVYADGVTIRETYGNGFVYQVDVLDMSDSLSTVWTGNDPSAPGSPVDYLVNWDQTSFLVKGVKIYVDTDNNPNTWEEIDAVQLSGDAPVPEPSTMLLLASGLIGLTGLRRKFRKR